MRKQEPKLVKSVMTKEYYVTTKYKELGNGQFLSIDKRPATKEEIRTGKIEQSSKSPKEEKA